MQPQGYSVTGGKVQKIAVIPGDGPGIEVMREVLRILDWFRANRSLHIDVVVPDYGLKAVESVGTMLPDASMDVLRSASVILFGAAGGPEYDPRYDHLPRSVRKTGSALRLRKELGLFANLRPVKAFDVSAEFSPLRAEIVDGVDLLIVRELLGGAYFGTPRGIEDLPDGDRRGINTHIYLASQIGAIAEVGFSAARTRSGRVCSVEKAAVMEAGLLWREEVTKVHDRFPDVELEHMAVDTCAQCLIQDPKRFDVILTDNMFGDILSDCASAIVGSVGLQSSACMGSRAPDGCFQALYEPVDAGDFHLAGRNQANPLGAILSLAMAFDHSFARRADAALLVDSVSAVLREGLRTLDLCRHGERASDTSEAGDAVLRMLDRANAA